MTTVQEQLNVSSNSEVEDLKARISENCVYDSKETIATLEEKIHKMVYRLRQFDSLVVLPSITYYTKDNDPNGLVESVRIIVKPKSTFALAVKVSKTIELSYTKAFFDTLAENLLLFVADYENSKESLKKLEVLNTFFREVETEYETPFGIAFELSNKKVVYVSDNEIVVGINEEGLEQIQFLPVGLEHEDRRESYKEKISEEIKFLNEPIDFIKTNTFLTKRLGVYTTKRKDILAKSSVTFNALHLDKGVGFLNRGDEYAILIKKPISSDEAESLKENYKEGVDYILLPNKKMTKVEKEKNQDKILVYFQLSPFRLDDKEVEGTLKDFVDFVEYYRENGNIPAEFIKKKSPEESIPVGIRKEEREEYLKNLKDKKDTPKQKPTNKKAKK